MRPHPVMHHPQLRPQPLHIVLDVRLETLQIDPALPKRMQRLLLQRLCLPLNPLPRLLPHSLEPLHKFPKVLPRNIRHALQRTRLHLLEPRMVENLPHRPLQRRALHPRTHQRPVLADHHTTHILLDKRRGIVPLGRELVLVGLAALDLHLLDQRDLGADLARLLHL